MDFPENENQVKLPEPEQPEEAVGHSHLRDMFPSSISICQQLMKACVVALVTFIRQSKQFAA
jgi:hypothetical protein